VLGNGERIVAIAVAIGIAASGCGGKTTPTAPTSAGSSLAAQVEPLRNAASSSGRLVGAAVQSGYLNDSRYAAALSRHFNYLTAEYEMKWGTIGRVQSLEDFSGGDAISAFALSSGMQLKGHALIWHGSTPSWVSSLSPADLRIAFESHIRSVAGHFRGRVLAWDVVNEAVADDGSGLRDTVFRQKLGDQYIADAFRLARDADPQALLFYNDYGGEGLNAKSERIYQLMQSLLAQGVPIDGIGLQMHVTATNPPADAAVAANMRRLAALGLRVNISEMDVRVANVPGSTQAKLDAQKSVYHSLVAVCVAEPQCHAVTFWGFTDAHSWIDGQFGPDDPLLFDEQYAAKPAFYGVLDAFFRR
jgi:GH35 family endo-1,4-beta-xylanase